jgi:hypothetical protein
MDNIGRKIAIINGGEYNGKYISVCDAEENKKTKFKTVDPFYDMELPNTHFFEPVPSEEKDEFGKIQRTISYFSAPSGSGKSRLTSTFCRNYQKLFPKNEVYLFSKIKEDKSIKIPNVKRLAINDELVHDPLEIQDFSNSMLILDDTDTITNKEYKNALQKLKVSILETGRHTNVSLIVTSHESCKGAETKSIISEAHYVALFLSSGQNYKYFMSQYLSFSLKEIEKLKQFNSRWIMLIKGYPLIILSEHSLLFRSDLMEI